MGFTSTERSVSTVTPVVNVDLTELNTRLLSIDTTAAQMYERLSAAVESISSAVAILSMHALNMGPAWLLNTDTNKFHQWIAAVDGVSIVPDISQTESWPAYLITTSYNIYIRHKDTMEFHKMTCCLDGSSVVESLEQAGTLTPTSPYHIINWLYEPDGGLWYRLWAATDGSIVTELNQTGVTIIA